VEYSAELDELIESCKAEYTKIKKNINEYIKFCEPFTKIYKPPATRDQDTY